MGCPKQFSKFPCLFTCEIIPLLVIISNLSLSSANHLQGIYASVKGWITK
jgi:hypothetical protein